MPRLRRLTGAFVHLLMLHLLLVGSGDACVLAAVATAAHPMAASANAADAGSMAGMTMPVRSTPGGNQDRDDAGTRSGGHSQPLAGCQSMAPCAPAALAAAATTVDRAAPLDAAPLGVVAVSPRSRTSAPEPPPPRA